MRALILGATGLVGHALWRDWKGRKGWDVHGTYAARPFPGLSRLDILDRMALERQIGDLKPELIALTASNPHVDHCEVKPDETRAINVDATAYAAHLADKYKAKLVYFSSDYVFDGSKAPYKEDFPVSPISEYGRQKVEAEKRVLAEDKDALILRISGVFGWALNRLNFVMQVLDRQAKGDPIAAADDIVSCPTYAPWLALIIPELAERNAKGILNAAGADEMSRYGLATLVAKVFGFDPAPIRRIKRAELKQPAARPPHSSLDTSRLAGLVKTPVWTTEESLRHMKSARQEWETHVRSMSALK